MRRRRIKGGYTISALGRELGIDKSHLSKAERGKLGMSPENLRKISLKLDIPMHELVPEIAETQSPA